MAQRRLQVHEGKKGYWITTRKGGRVFIEEENYRKWLFGAGVGIVATAIGAVVGKKIGLFTKIAAPLKLGRVIREAWQGRHILANFMKSNAHPGQARFQHKVTSFTKLKNDRYLLGTDLRSDYKSVGRASFLLDQKHKRIIIKELSLKDFGTYQTGLGKALQSPYEFATDNGYRSLHVRVHQGEQSHMMPRIMGVTWANAKVERKMKEAAVAEFDRYLKELPAEEQNAWNYKRVVERIRKAHHPDEIVSGIDRNNQFWGLGAFMEAQYYRTVGPRIMSKIPSWNGKIDLAERTYSHMRFNNLVYPPEMYLSGERRGVGAKISDFFFKELEGTGRPSKFYGTRGTKKSTLPPEQVRVAQEEYVWVEPADVAGKMRVKKKLLVKVAGSEKVTNPKSAVKTPSDRKQTYEEAKATVEKNLEKATKATLTADEAKKAEAKALLQMKKIEASEKKIDAFAFAKARREELKNATALRWDAVGKIYNDIELNQEVEKLVASLDKEGVLKYISASAMTTVKPSGSIKLHTITGHTETLEWWRAGGRQPYTHVEIKVPGSKRKMTFKVYSFLGRGKNLKTGKGYRVPVYRISRGNGAALKATRLAENPINLDLEFQSENEALNHIANWVRASGHFPHLAPIIIPGKRQTTMISEVKKFRFAIRPGKLKGFENQWRIHPIGKAKEQGWRFEKIFNSREEAERWLELFLMKAQV